MAKKLLSDQEEYDKNVAMTQKILDDKFAQGRLTKLSMSEILEGINEVKTFEERVQVLRNNSERSLNTLLLFTFDGLPWALSPEDIRTLKYKVPSADDDVFIHGTNLHQEAKRFYIFRLDTLPRLRALHLLAEMLENLHPDEGEILKGMMLGSLPYENITKQLVAAAFPDLFPGYVPEEEGKQEEQDTKTPAQEDQAPKSTSSTSGAKSPRKSKPKKEETPNASV